jgi:hypothetical protein
MRREAGLIGALRVWFHVRSENDLSLLHLEAHCARATISRILLKPTHSTDAYALNTSRHLRETIVTSTLATLYAAVIPHMNTFNDDS